MPTAVVIRVKTRMEDDLGCMVEIWSLWVNRSETTAYTARDNEVIIADISKKVIGYKFKSIGI